MKEEVTGNPPVSPSLSPLGTGAQGSLEEQPSPNTPAPLTGTASTCMDEDRAMEVKQITLLKRSAEIKEHSKKEGVLAAHVVSNCLSNPRQCSPGQLIYQSLSLPGRNLRDVSILCNYVHLQKLELRNNKIKDLSCLSHMPHLVVLDASHNELPEYFGFQPLKNLKEVNFSNNHMTKMKDLSAYSSLSKLDLDYNNFSDISGLQLCRALTHLSLAHNKIGKISGLDNLPLKHLDLRGNQLEKIEGLETLNRLQVMDLSLNRISSLSGLQNLHQLLSIHLKKNLISELKEATHIHELSMLGELNFQGNPVQEQPDYRLSIIFLLQHVNILDQQKVTAEEKVCSVNKYDPPLELLAAKDHMTHMMYQLMQPQVLFDSTLSNTDSPYPMLVLTGPQACGKRELAHRLSREFDEYFAYAACHTTRGPYYGEEDKIDYHFVSEEEFQHMIYMGKFIQTMEYGGHSYGLSREAIEAVAREGLASCLHMEMEGVLSLKNTYFEPRYILLIPTQVEQYTRRLNGRGLYTCAQIDTAVSRIELYANTNRLQPGFYDHVICCDDQEEAYKILKQVVMEYLGLEEHQRDGELSVQASTASAAPEPRPEGRATPLRSSPALDPSDPSCRNYWHKVCAFLSPQKSSTELASIGRREQLVRRALEGRSAAAYSHLFKRSAPASLPSQSQDPVARTVKDKPYPYEETSSSESCASSALSVPSSAGALSGAAAPRGGVDPVPGSAAKLPDAGSGQTSATPRPDADHLSVSSSSHRPGSDAKPVLPPIPARRKTPAPSSSPH